MKPFAARLRAFVALCPPPVERKPGPLLPLEWTHVQPGDAIVVNMPPGLTDLQRADLIAHIRAAKAHLPEGVSFIVGNESMRLCVVRGASQ